MGTPDVATGESKVSFEAKFKSTTGGQTHECSIKQDGAFSYDLKSNVLEVRFKLLLTTLEIY